VINDPCAGLFVGFEVSEASKYHWLFAGLDLTLTSQKFNLPADTYSLMSSIWYDIAGFSRCLCQLARLILLCPAQFLLPLDDRLRTMCFTTFDLVV
jgi:hypothetical protein